jgi:hypothetical protein
MTLHPILLSFLILEENFMFFFYQCTLTLSIYHSSSLFSAVVPSETLTRNTSPGTDGARVVCPVVEDCVVVIVVVRVEVVEGMVGMNAGVVFWRHTPPVQDKPAQHWVILAKIKVFKKMFVVFRSHYVTVLNNVDTHSTK